MCWHFGFLIKSYTIKQPGPAQCWTRVRAELQILCLWWLTGAYCIPLTRTHRIPSHCRGKTLEGAHLSLKQLTPIKSDIKCTPPSGLCVKHWQSEGLDLNRLQFTRAYTEHAREGRKKKKTTTKDKTFLPIQMIGRKDGETQWCLSDHC